MSKMGLLE
jgi:hypothetical protein